MAPPTGAVELQSLEPVRVLCLRHVFLGDSRTANHKLDRFTATLEFVAAAAVPIVITVLQVDGVIDETIVELPAETPTGGNKALRQANVALD